MFAPLGGWVLNGGPIVLTIGASLGASAITQAEFYVCRDARSEVVAEAIHDAHAYAYRDGRGMVIACCDTWSHDFVVLADGNTTKVGTADAYVDALALRPFWGESDAEAETEAINSIVRRFVEGEIEVEALGEAYVDGLALRPFFGDVEAEAETEGDFTRWAQPWAARNAIAIAAFDSNLLRIEIARGVNVRMTMVGGAQSWAIHTHALLQNWVDDAIEAETEGYFYRHRWQFKGDAICTSHWENPWFQIGARADLQADATVGSSPTITRDGIRYSYADADLVADITATLEDAAGLRRARQQALVTGTSEVPDADDGITILRNTTMRGYAFINTTISIQFGIHAFLDAEAVVEVDPTRHAMIVEDLVVWSQAKAYNEFIGITRNVYADLQAEAVIKRADLLLPVWPELRNEIPNASEAWATGRVVPRIREDMGVVEARALVQAANDVGYVMQSGSTITSRALTQADLLYPINLGEMEASVEARIVATRMFLNTYRAAPIERQFIVPASTAREYWIPTDDRTYKL